VSHVIPKFIAIGHLTQDLLPGGTYAPGGTVSFASIAAHHLGQSAAIVTVAPSFLRNLPIYKEIQIVGRIIEETTIFENIYTAQGREQFIRSVAPLIQPEDVPLEWVGYRKGVEVVHLGPVAQECPPNLLDLFPDALIGITPQGFMRTWDMTTGRVSPLRWEGTQAHALLSKAHALVLSEEDLPPGAEGNRLLQEYIEGCPVVVYTQGHKGCIVYYEGKAETVPAFPAQERDPTGAGDLFAAAFFIRLRATHNPIEAARFANAAASCKIEKLGLTEVPTLEQVYQRMNYKN